MPVNVREPLDPKASLWHFLAWLLRYEREKQGLSLTQWGKIICAARSTVSNIEAGRLKIDEKQAMALDRRFGTGRLYEVLLWFARTMHNPDWGRQFIHYEATAETLRIYHGQAIPGALQTDAYARALIEAGDATDIDAETAERNARKKTILEREDPPFLWVLIDESVLAFPVGGNAVMRDQLRHLRAMADRPNVIVRIVPTASGAHPGVDGPFQVFSLEDRDIAYSGAQNGGRLIEATREVKKLRVRFERIGAKAASEDGSRALIEQYLERFS